MEHWLDGRGPGVTRQGRSVLDELFSVTYEELRRLAFAVKRNAASMTLNPTALVNEAWLKLANSPQVAATSRLHFKRIAACAMRQVLVEAARRRNASKRGGAGVMFVTLDDSIEVTGSSEQNLLALDDVLRELEHLDPRQATLVECRFFGGLGVSETATVLEISEATVNREWRTARAWLKHRLREAR
jgi:RNA polymerase sigma factor (TIGR02999 family)